MVLVTGASSGIGRESARIFGREGCRMALAARRVNLMEELADEIRQFGSEAAVFQVDFSQQGSTAELSAQVMHCFGQVDILVNNAGMGRLDWLEDLDLKKDIESQLQVNLLSTISLTRQLLPQMVARGNGSIINVASIASFLATPMYSIYAASKFGLRGFTDSLRREVRLKGVSVTGIYPGFTDTEFPEHVGRLSSRGARTPRWMWMTSEQVGRQVVKAAIHPRRAVIMPWYMQFAIAAEAFAPGLVDAALDRWFVRRELDRSSQNEHGPV